LTVSPGAVSASGTAWRDGTAGRKFEKSREWQLTVN
jgi:hypothetical protein